MDANRGDDWPARIRALCRFYKKLPAAIMAMTLAQYNTAVEAMNEEREAEARAAEG